LENAFSSVKNIGEIVGGSELVFGKSLEAGELKEIRNKP
jgi:hypothetical protein